MTNLASIWANTQAEGNTEDNPAPIGYVGVCRIGGSRAGTSKKGEQYFAVDLVDDQQGYRWPIFKQFTANGQPHEGRIKAAKIVLRQLGLEVADPTLLAQALKGIEGRYYAIEVTASKDLNPLTGSPYPNTTVTGVASAPTLNVAQQQQPAAPAPQVQAPQPQPPQPTLDQVMTGQVTAAAAMQQQVAQAVAAPNVDPHPFA